MRRIPLALGVIGAVGISLLTAKLDSVDLDEFREAAPCGFVVKVTELKAIAAREHPHVSEVYPQVFSDPRIFGTYDSEGLILEATMTVRGVIGSNECRPLRPILTGYFSSEDHSSHPQIDDLAVVFLRVSNDVYYEAIYGRSYWPILGEAEERGIEVGWRNDFLAQSGDARAARGTRLPLGDVLELFGGMRPWGRLP